MATRDRTGPGRTAGNIPATRTRSVRGFAPSRRLDHGATGPASRLPRALADAALPDRTGL